MSKTGRAAFGIQKLNRRYSNPNHLKGAKISAEKMNRTMSLKFKKVNEVKTARSHNELIYEQEMNQLVKDQEPSESRLFFRTYHRIFKAPPMKNKLQLQNNSLFIDTKYPKLIKCEQEQVHHGRPVYFSSNLQEKKNLYLNGLLNRSEEQYMSQKKDIQIKLSEQPMVRKQSLNLQNLFWRKMKRVSSQRKEDTSKQSNL